MLPCGGYTPRFKLQSQATLLLDTGGRAMASHGTLPAYGTIALCGDPFQGSSWGRNRHPHSHPLHSPQHLLELPQVGGQAVLGRQLQTATPWLTERHGYDPTCGVWDDSPLW